MTTDIDPLAQYAYREGMDPIDWGIWLAQVQIDVRGEVVDARTTDPNSFPGYLLDLDNASLARRVVGELLDAGWTPPTAVGT